ncbi:6-phosphogluconolactonase [Porphyromonas sp.]|uniref:6-phosphogluconolactonase n=1 Tax=Porphyromonas sp. TaxID=1924944 RepID=UPI0026DCFD48|nr:6-phosphogluconolactonase [Porphyromonas sp.]MDO4771196.1 6-phosphogluconolactonase [Porphyromonas sp.]
MTINYNHYTDPQAVAEALSERIIDLYDAGGARPYSVALSGGSTPKALFDFWCAHPEEIRDKDIHFWWVDERMVPEESKDSNYGNALRAVFQPIGYDPKKLHPIRHIEGQSIDEAVEKYNAEAETFRLKHGKSSPFDLIILGVGEDGHTSSLFPGQALYEVEEDFLRSVHPTNGIERVALSYEGIRRSPKTLFHVTGQAKTERLAQVITLAEGDATDTDTRLFPAAYAMRIAKGMEIYTDIPLR